MRKRRSRRPVDPELQAAVEDAIDPGPVRSFIDQEFRRRDYDIVFEWLHGGRWRRWYGEHYGYRNPDADPRRGRDRSE